MEVGIQDRYHSTRTPSFSESRSGDKVVWNFRTTLQIRNRAKKDYKAHRDLEPKPEQAVPPSAETTTESEDTENTTTDSGDQKSGGPQS